MVLVFAALYEVGAGIEAGEGMEVMDKVGLIEVAAGEGDIGPIDLLLVADEGEDFLKAANAAKQLGGQADFGGKELDEAPGTEADLGSYLRDGAQVGNMAELVQGEINGGMASWGAGKQRQQGLFKKVELEMRRWSGE